MTEFAEACPRPTVHVIDDDLPLRDGLANLLRSWDFTVVTFASPQAFVDAWRPEDCGCLLLDIRFPGGNGLDYQGQFYAAGIHMPVILMTAHADVPSTVRGMKAGAIDFLLKPFDDDELIAAVTLALDRDGSRRRRMSDVAGYALRYASLTSREKEVLTLVVTGLMNKQVAGEMGLSEITVKVHRGTMMKKMGVKTLPALVRAFEALNSVVDA
jgi:FixJ family two-component response regulator